MAANEAVDALQDELVALTCEEQKPSPFKKLPPSVFIALARRYLNASQRVALAARKKVQMASLARERGASNRLGLEETEPAARAAAQQPTV